MRRDRGVVPRFSANGHGRKLTSDQVFKALVSNALPFMNRLPSGMNLLDQVGTRDLDAECKYPKVLNIQVYRQLFDRVGIANKIVRVYPEECWATKAEIYEIEENRVTRFENVFNALRKRHRFDHYLYRLDVLSGLGRYGGLLIRTNDPRPLNTAPAGVNEDGTKTPRRTDKMREIVWMRPMAEDHLRVVKVEKKGPRLGQPKEYEIDLDATTDSGSISDVPHIDWSESDEDVRGDKVRVHWSRVLHVADGLQSSEWYGTPRLQPVANLVWDCRKVLGASAEMFYKGAFFGLSIETTEGAHEFYDVDMDELKEEVEAFQEGLQRFLRLVNMNAKSLAPQVADPKSHMEQLLSLISAVIGVPKPVLLGAEVGKSDGGMNVTTWNRRLALRNQNHVEPYIWRPFIGRLQLLDVLPDTPKDYFVTWNDLNTQTEKDRADVALKLTQALLQYVSSGAYNVVKPRQYFTNWLKFPDEVVSAMLKSAGGEQKILSALKSQMKMQNQPAAGRTPGTTGTSPTRRTGSSGQRNGLGSGRKPRRAN